MGRLGQGRGATIADPAAAQVEAPDAGDMRRPRKQRCAGVDIPEIRRRYGVADGLVDTSEIDVGGGLQNQRVDAGSGIDRQLGTAIRNGIVAGAGRDDVGAAAAVHGVVAGTGRDRIDGG